MKTKAFPKTLYVVSGEGYFESSEDLEMLVTSTPTKVATYHLSEVRTLREKAVIEEAAPSKKGKKSNGKDL